MGTLYPACQQLNQAANLKSGNIFFKPNTALVLFLLYLIDESHIFYFLVSVFDGNHINLY